MQDHLQVQLEILMLDQLNKAMIILIHNKVNKKSIQYNKKMNNNNSNKI